MEDGPVERTAAAMTLPDEAVVLPDEEEAAGLADAAPLLTAVRELVDALGDEGRELTAAGELAVGDVVELADCVGADLVDPGRPPASSRELPGLCRAVDVALEAGFVRRHRSHLVPIMSRRAMLIDDPDDAWMRLAEAVLAVGPLALARTEGDDTLPSVLTEALDAGAFGLLERLYRRGPADTREVDDRARQQAADRTDAAEPHEVGSRARVGLARQLTTLAHAGAVGWQSGHGTRATDGDAGGANGHTPGETHAGDEHGLSVDPDGRWPVGQPVPPGAAHAGVLGSAQTLAALAGDEPGLRRTLALTPLGAGLVHRRLGSPGPAADASPDSPSGWL